MKDLLGFAPGLFGWPWSKVGYILALGLFYRALITFDQALLLIGLAIVIERLTPRAKVSSAELTSGTRSAKKTS